MPLDVPFEQLGGKHRRLIMHGTGEQWFDVRHPPARATARERTGATARRRRPSVSSTRGFTPPWKRPAAFRPASAAGWSTWSTRSSARSAAAAGCATTRRPCGFRGRTIDEMCRMPLGKLLAEFHAWKPNATERKIAGEVFREIRNRLQFLVDVGLEYLTLARPAPTLSGGEMQRIRLAAQVGSGLCGVLYVLDEPTIGLHPRDNRRLLDALKKLRDLGNTLLVVEHDREVIASADQLLGFRPRRRPARRADRRRGHAGPGRPSAAARSPGRICPARRRSPCRRIGGWPSGQAERRSGKWSRRSEESAGKKSARRKLALPSPLRLPASRPAAGWKSSAPGTTT